MHLSRAFLVICMASSLFAENIVFPENAGLVDVTKSPYELKGDGKFDNTVGLRKVFADHKGSSGTLYFPNGIYLISDRVNISADEPSQPHSRDRFLNIQGQSQAGAILRLADNASGYNDPANPKTFISLYEGTATGDVMHSYVRNITVEIGKGNPGAAALRFLTNNTGAIYNVTIRSLDPQKAGAIGLDMRQGQNGPGYIKNITVDGFDYGIHTGYSFSMVYENITIRNQRKIGFFNTNSRSAIHNLVSVNSVPALVNELYGHITLITANLTGGGSQAAIINNESACFVRDVTVQGYTHSLRTRDSSYIDGTIQEWHEGSGYSLFGAQPQTLRLPIKASPEIMYERNLSKWVKVEYGINTIQDAIDKAVKIKATTIYFPKPGINDTNKEYVITKPVRIYGSVRHIIGLENIVDVSDPDSIFKSGKSIFTFEKLTHPTIILERFLLLGGWKCPTYANFFENKSGKTVMLSNISMAGNLKRADPGGTWFIEDVAPSRESTLDIGPKESVWARQYNPETFKVDMMHINNGLLWILGLKTEGRTRHVVASNGAQVEILGGVSYQSWGNQELDPPMFTIDSTSRASFTFGLYHTDTPFSTLVEETLNGETRTLPANTMGTFLPVYRSGSGLKK